MTGYLFEYASAAKSPARMSRLLLHLLVRFSVPKQLFAPSKTMADSPTDIDGVFAFKCQNVAKERFYSVVHPPPPPYQPRLCVLRSSRTRPISVIPSVTDSFCHNKGTAAALTLFSVAASAQTGPYYGKGKAPPPPVDTKG